MKTGATLDDREFRKALRTYCDIKKNVNLKAELRRRAKNVGMRLAKIYKDKGVSLNEIEAKVKSLGNRVKIRPKIRAKGKVKRWTHQRMIQAELRARKSSKGFTATGWFPSIEKLGGTPRDISKRTAPQRGKLIEKFGAFEMSETLVNQQPSAGYVQGKVISDEQKALDAEAADMVKYIVRKQDEAARQNGL